jgi:hypothetical protein
MGAPEKVVVSTYGPLLPTTLSQQVRNFILRNIKLTVDRALVTVAGVRATGSGYEMVFGDKYFESDPYQQKTVVLHELSHIFRGDCLLFLKDNKLDTMRWNVSADCLINEGLPKQHIKDLQGVLYYDGIQTIKPGVLPEQWLPPTRTIYDALEQEEGGEGYGSGSQKNGLDELMRPEGDASELRKVHARIVLEAREALEGCEEGKKLLLGSHYSLVKASSTRHVESVPTPIPLASILLRKLTGVRNGSRELVRTYRRPGRVELLRGSARLPRLSVLAAIDVSGSCTSLVPQFVGAGAWLGRRHSVELCMFDTEVHKFSSDVSYGGGTCFRPVWEYAQAGKYDAILMLSDGEAGDIKPHPKVPVIWVVPESHNRQLHLRPGMDSVIVMPELGK